MSGGGCYAYRDTGKCRFGDNCRFGHDGAPGVGGGGGDDGGYRGAPSFRGGGGGGGGGTCYSWRDYGECRFGDTCRFDHSGDAGTGGGGGGGGGGRGFGGGGGGRGGGGMCYQFNDNGSCPYGDNCRFSHGDAGGAGGAGGGGGGGGYGGGGRGGGGGGGECWRFKEGGNCPYGDGCRFSHAQS